MHIPPTPPAPSPSLTYALLILLPIIAIATMPRRFFPDPGNANGDEEERVAFPYVTWADHAECRLKTSKRLGS